MHRISPLVEFVCKALNILLVGRMTGRFRNIADNAEPYWDQLDESISTDGALGIRANLFSSDSISYSSVPTFGMAP